jgi:Spy/CpxP family protein refolding chaperone
MKKLLLLFIASALVSAAAIAQMDVKKDYKKERTEWETKIKTDLNLTADQSAKFDALNKEYNEKIDAIAMDATTDKAALKEKKMALKKEKETKLFEILTAEQQTKYKEIMEKKKKDMEAKPSGN